MRLKELEEKHKREMKTIQDEITAWTEVFLKGNSPFLDERCLNKKIFQGLISQLRGEVIEANNQLHRTVSSEFSSTN